MAVHAERFEGLAEAYALYRPDYPARAFRDLLPLCTSDRALAVDVGAGPGTSTRALRAALPESWLVTAVEPGRDMRRVLARSFRDDARVQATDGRAEALPLPDGSAGLVVACSAFHWFDAPGFYAEARRVMASGAVLALMRNRMVPSPLTEEIAAHVALASRTAGAFGEVAAQREPTVRELSSVEGFKTARSRTYSWTEARDLRGVVDFYLTRSSVWSLVRRVGLGQVMSDLEEICARHIEKETAAPLAWETTVKWTQRR
ncbi:class I SAM-dependent methyltransferase [Oceanicola sp. S124]|uniref:class I SAM-dependent methyltransferase n=1 Tax=Oceanicola sp. S124 TaxID=1042378 RepID=UPI0002559042|nr:class I SAM-dependent methyltransferase [Oceanicola sp. S124]